MNNNNDEIIEPKEVAWRREFIRCTNYYLLAVKAHIEHPTPVTHADVLMSGHDIREALKAHIESVMEYQIPAEEYDNE